MKPRGSDVIRTRAATERRLRRHHDLIASAGDGKPQYLLCKTAGIHVGAIEQSQTAVDADVEQAPRALRICRTPCLEKVVAAAECPRAEAQHRNFEPGSAQLSVFHRESSCVAPQRYP